MKPIVVGLGEVLWDVFRDDNGLILKRILGGAPANFVFHSQQLGLGSVLVSAIGRDENGEAILKELDKRGINRILSVTSYDTGCVDIYKRPDGETRYVINTDVAYDHIQYSRELEDLIPQVKAVCFGTLAQRDGKDTADTVRRFLQSLGDDVFKVYDINLRPTCDVSDYTSKDQQSVNMRKHLTEIYTTSLRLSNILKINQAEFPILMDLLEIQGESEQQKSHALMEMFDLFAIVHSLGAEGSRIYFRNGNSEIEVSEVNDVNIDRLAEELNIEKDADADFVGAGDSLTAALITGLVMGLPLREAHKKASRVATYVCTRQGAMPKLDERLMLNY